MLMMKILFFSKNFCSKNKMMEVIYGTDILVVNFRSLMMFFTICLLRKTKLKMKLPICIMFQEK